MTTGNQWLRRLRGGGSVKHDGQAQGLPITRPRRTERYAITAFVISIILAVGLVAVAVIAISAKREAHQERLGKIGAVQALGTANSSLTKNGLAPVATPTAAGPAPTVTATVHETGPAGQQGATGPGPSNAQIAVAVESYCTAVHCGSGPTAAQVAQAVATYCDANGKCRGATGQSGTNGAPGQTGASGAPGQNATAEQVADAVSTYCAAHSGCQGPAGPSGAPGSPGANGQDGASGAPGANGTDGQPPYSWTYTDPLGGQHSCVRSDPFDMAKPTYTCS